MPSLIWSSSIPAVDGSIKKKVTTFMEKLCRDDTAPGLHVEPVKAARDPRVRTGRVDEQYRAVMFRMVTDQGTSYLIDSILNHDDAYERAVLVSLRIHPNNGMLDVVTEAVAAGNAAAKSATPAFQEATPQSPAKTAAQISGGDSAGVDSAGPQGKKTQSPFDSAAAQISAKPSHSGPSANEKPLLTCTVADLVSVLGFDEELAQQVVACMTEDHLQALIERHDGAWQGLALLELVGDKPVKQVADTLGLAAPSGDLNSDEAVQDALQSAGNAARFAFLDGDEDLRRVIEDGDFGRWRKFLHPAQRAYVKKRTNGPFRLSGGAGTGKTVVLLHRAVRLATENPQARVVLTTFNKTLADQLQYDAKRLNPHVRITHRIGEPGLCVVGVDALASQVLRIAGDTAHQAMQDVLGYIPADISKRPTPINKYWYDALASVPDLPPAAHSVTFLESEYKAVVLAHRITTEREYLTVRRVGRGASLQRRGRAAVWKAFSAYRNHTNAEGMVTFAEILAIAAQYLHHRTEQDFPCLADHVLVDEGQDLSVVHWQFLRELVAHGPDDLFIADDCHQRIYGEKITMSQCGVEIRGRSQRLRLNYRTTAENLAFAVAVLGNAKYYDVSDEAIKDSTELRSARSGPEPRAIRVGSLSEEFDKVAGIVKKWTEGLGDSNTGDSKVALDTVGVLLRENRDCNTAATALQERDVKCRVVTSNDHKPGVVQVMTMHRAKGMEFTKVVLMGVTQEKIPASVEGYGYSEPDKEDAALRERSLLYVAASRARDELVVTYKGEPSPLLPTSSTA